MTNSSPALDRAKIEAIRAAYSLATTTPHSRAFVVRFEEIVALCDLEALAHTAPSGSDMVLVPVEPTSRMCAAGESAASFGIGKVNDDEAIKRVWRDMLAAAPPRPQPQGD